MIQLIDLWERFHFKLFMVGDQNELSIWLNCQMWRTKGVLMQVSLYRKSRGNYNKAIPYISKDQIYEEDKKFLKKESW